MDHVYRATRVYEGRVTETFYAANTETAKALIRNHVHLEEPAEWTRVEDGLRLVLTNPSDDDVEVEIQKHRVYGEEE